MFFMFYRLEPWEGFGVKKTVQRTVFSRKRESGTEMQSIWVDERGSMRGKPSRRRALLFPPKNIDTLLSVYVFLLSDLGARTLGRFRHRRGKLCSPNKLFNLPLDILLYSAIIIKPHIMGSKKCTSVHSPIVARLMKESYYYVRSYRNRRKAVQGI